MTEPHHSSSYSAEQLAALRDHVFGAAPDDEPDDKPPSLHVPLEGANPQASDNRQDLRGFVADLFGDPQP